LSTPTAAQRYLVQRPENRNGQKVFTIRAKIQRDRIQIDPM